jgi:hypothetical protein
MALMTMTPRSPEKAEKADISIEEHAPQPGYHSKLEGEEPIPELGSAEREYVERKLVRRLDIRLLPTVVIIYLMNYIDVRVICRLSSIKTYH